MHGNISKASGKIEEFDRQKLFNSLISSGASSAIAEDIVQKIFSEIGHGASTKDIYRMTRKYLGKYDSVSGMRYSIKKAIYDLGPSGYPFERYIARILRTFDFEVEIGKIISGYCIKHEVDIVAKRNEECYLVECKFHQKEGVASDVKVALYLYSRFSDIKKAAEHPSGHQCAVEQGWLITNTRFSSDAIKFANCVGLLVTGWKYPKHGSLEKMIEDKKVYPVTVLPAVNRRILDVFIKNNLVLASDITLKGIEDLMTITHLDSETVSRIKMQATTLCL